jgi:hypothetical protein
MNGTLTNYNAGSSTLTGGTYNALSGTIALSQANGSNVGTSAVIATNAASILLDGASAKITDASGNNILDGHFTTNASAGNFTLQNGANLTSSAASDFTNAGKMTVGNSSTFTVGGGHDYANSGTLQGTGTIQANLLVNSGTVHPGDSPGILNVAGNYSQLSAGHLDIQIGGANAGTGFSELTVSGNATLGGFLDLSLINGFTPFDGEQFVILNSSGLFGTFDHVNGLVEGNVTFTVEYSPIGFVPHFHAGAVIAHHALRLRLGRCGDVHPPHAGAGAVRLNQVALKETPHDRATCGRLVLCGVHRALVGELLS